MIGYCHGNPQASTISYGLAYGPVSVSPIANCTRCFQCLSDWDLSAVLEYWRWDVLYCTY
jgi:hypothetical protein